MRSASSPARSAAWCSDTSATSTAEELLQFALLLVGAVTFLMGCLPTFGQIGFWAPVLLVVLRFLQGFAVGGEWGGAVLLVAEHSPNKSRAFWASWPQAAVPVGNMLATVVLWVLTATLSEADSCPGDGGSRSGCPRWWS